MKNFIICLVQAIFLLSFVPVLAKTEGGETLPRTVLTCPLANEEKAVLKIRKYYDYHPTDGWTSPVIQIDGKQEKLDFIPDNQFMGSVDMYRCIHNLLFVTWSRGSGYTNGVVIRANPKTHAIERLDFSEKNSPDWIYMDDSKMILVIRNFFYYNVGKPYKDKNERKYIIYRYISGKGQLDEADASPRTNQLPTPSKYLYRIR